MLKGHFGDLTISGGKKHSFLEMDIEFNDKKNIEIDVKDQLNEIVSMKKMRKSKK